MKYRAASCVVGIIAGLAAGCGGAAQAADPARLSRDQLMAAKAEAKSKPAQEKEIAESYKAFGGENEAFRCSVPADWRQTRDAHDDERSHTFGVLLSGPADADGVSPTISLRFYGPGNPTADDAEARRRRRQKPPTGRCEKPPRNGSRTGRGDAPIQS